MKLVLRPNIMFALAVLAVFSTLNSQLSTAFAQGTAFTYQGQLQNNGQPISGTFNLQFTLYANSAGSGSPTAGPVTNNSVLVSNDVFTVAIDFGAGPWTGQSNWLQIAVETNHAATFTTLSPLQLVTPVPYAIYAENAGTATTANNVAAGSVTATGIASATITAGNIASGQVVKSLNNINDAVTLSAGNNITITPSGHTLTISGSGSGGSGWALTGNSGTTPGTDFVGTTDYNPLEMHVYSERAYRLEPTGLANQPNVIGGSVLNADSGIGVTISGGYSNNIGAVFYASIGGGSENIVQGGESTIAGGYQNMIQSGSATFSTIGGGISNTNASTESTIAGGAFNEIESSAETATIGGGQDNTVLGGADYATIGGGTENSNAAPSATIAGGYENQIQPGADYCAIGGGDSNVILTNSAAEFFDLEIFQYVYGAWAVVGGGLQNTLGTAGSFIGSGFYNTIDTNGIEEIYFPSELEYTGGWSVLGGGAQNTISAGTSFIGGGGFNWIEPNATWSVIGGGEQNVIDTNSATSSYSDYLPNALNTEGAFAVIGGGVQNLISSGLSFIGGGNFNTIGLYSSQSVIAGGVQNSITNSANEVIGGGQLNTIGSSSSGGIIAAGYGNQILSASSDCAIGGGYQNSISNMAFGATISGGAQNVVSGNKIGGAIPGGYGNLVAGQYSFAAGNLAQCTNDDCFVWSDGFGYYSGLGNGGPAYSTGPNQFIIGARGGVGINTAPTNNANVGTFGTLPFDVTTYHGIYAPYLYLSGAQGIYAANGQGTFNNVTVNNTLNAYTVNGTYVNGIINGSSDRNLKDHFAPIKAGDILDKVVALPISQWDFKTDEQARHLGPMAQDFHKAFGLNGGDDKHIGVLDEGGVALAAIQGLNEKLEDRCRKADARDQILETENTKLQAEVEELRAMVMQVAQSKTK